MQVLITGAGLIGSRAAAELIARGHEVVLYDREPNEAYVRSVVKTPVELRRGNASDFVTLLDVMLAKRFDCVVHTAGLIGGAAQRQPWTALQANVLSTIAVVEAARVAKVGRIVFTSTHGVYDHEKCKNEPINEQSPVASASVYAACKLSAEHLLEAYGKAHDIDTIVVRFANVYGRGLYIAGSSGGQHFNALVEPVARGLAGRILPAVKGRGEWLYVRDAANALTLAAERKERSGHLLACIGTGTLTTEEDIIAAIRRVVPNAKFEVAETGPIHRAAERHQPYDLTHARRTLGYEPQWHLENGVADYLQEVRETLRG